MAMAAVAMSAQGETNSNHQMSFDTDSGPIGVDNRFTGCISHIIEDFKGPIVDYGQPIKGFGGKRNTDV